MHKYDYRFLKDSTVDPDTLGRVGNIERIDALMDAPDVLDGTICDALELRALVMSVADSNAIEGIYTDESRLAGIISGKTIPRGHDEQEIAGYRAALRLIHQEHENIDITVESILEIYGVLMGQNPNAYLGFKTRDNAVIERDREGRIAKIHEKVPASEVDDNMRQLVWAFREARDDSEINNLLLIPCFIDDFLMIHPFADGNGRMSRLLTTLLLYQEGYEVCRYVSMESKINSSKADYYRALEDSQAGWSNNDNDYMPFVSYFLTQLFLCYRELNLAMASEIRTHVKSGGLEQFMERTVIPMSKRDLCQLFPSLSESTVERVLADMVREGRIEKIGRSRSTRYMPLHRQSGGRERMVAEGIHHTSV